MDNDTTCDKPEKFGTLVAKSFVLSTASSAGVFGGMFLVGLALTAADKRKNRRETKDTTPTES